MKRIVSLILLIFTLALAAASFTSCKNKPQYVRMSFKDYGEIVIELDYENAPKTAKNFAKLVRHGFYDGLLINRAQENFVLQGGSPTEGQREPDTIKGEFASNGYDNDISHVRGVISMARSNDPDSASSTFFICLSDYCTQLDGDYAGFGRVVEGMDIVDQIVEDMAPYGYYMGFVDDEHSVVIEKAWADYEYSPKN